MDDNLTATGDSLWLRVKRHFTEAFAGNALSMPDIRSSGGREWLHERRRHAYRYILAFLSAILMPVIMHNFYIGLPVLAWAACALLSLLLVNIVLLTVGRDAVLSPVIILSSAIGLDMLLFYMGQTYALYLLFPLLIGLPILLPGRHSLRFCVGTLALAAPVLSVNFPLITSLVAAFSLALCWLISTWLVFALTEQAKRLRGMAITDPLTGAYNRRYMELRAAKGLEAWGRYGRDETLVVLDIDHFKRINDRFGHERGDRALEALVKVLRERVRSADTLCRFGGEEFVLLLSETCAERALKVADELRAAVEQAEILPEGSMTISLGVCQVGEASTVDQWFQLADRALYVAKSRGRNCVELATAARFRRPPRGMT